MATSALKGKTVSLEALLRAAKAEPKPNQEANRRAALENTWFSSQQGENLSSQKQDREERKRYAAHFFKLACSWVMVISALLVLQGFHGYGAWEFHLSDPVTLSAIGATTINILGILYVVAKYLFPPRK